MNPIGSFNQNHDSPKWEFTDRPIAMTQMLPDTWNNSGFGIYGKWYQGPWMVGYELYLTGGFNDSIIDNSEGKTFLPAAKNNPSRFTASASGEPMYSGKITLRRDPVGELGISGIWDVYNTWEKEGAPIDQKRSLYVIDLDYKTILPVLHTSIITEWAWVNVQIPPDYTPQYASRQFGGFMDVVQPLFTCSLPGMENALVNLAVRLEYVDWNLGHFAATGTRMYNDLWSIMPAISLRPSSRTVIRFNYRYQMQRDITGNTIGATLGQTGAFSLGIASYF